MDEPITVKPDLDNLFRLGDMYLTAAFKLTLEAIVKDEYDAVTAHISVKKAKEIFEQIKMLTNKDVL